MAKKRTRKKASVRLAKERQALLLHQLSAVIDELWDLETKLQAEFKLRPKGGILNIGGDL